MRGFWAVLRREVEERWHLPLLGLFLGVLCPITAYLPLGFRASRQDLLDSTALSVAMIFFSLTALLLGLGLFASDQAAGRTGFYLARPIRPWQLAMGRVVAAVLLIGLSTNLILLPTFALTGKLLHTIEGPSLHLGLYSAALAFALGHVVAVALKLRNQWSLLDLAAFASTMLLVGSTVGRSSGAEIPGIPEIVILLLGVVAMVAASLGVWVQLRFGGTQRGRLHAVFSLTFWPLLLGAALFFDLHLRSELAKGWEDIRSFQSVVPSNDGSAVWLKSTDHLTRALYFVVDFEENRRIAVETSRSIDDSPLLRGRTVLWTECSPRNCSLRMLNLEEDRPVPIDLGSTDHPSVVSGRLLLSTDGKVVWRVERDQLLRHEVSRWQQVTEIEVPDVVSLAGTLEDGSVAAVRRRNSGWVLEAVSHDGSRRQLARSGSKNELAEPVELWSRRGLRLRVNSNAAPNHSRVPTELLGDSLTSRATEGWTVWTHPGELSLFRRDLEGVAREPIVLPPRRRLHQTEALRQRWQLAFLGPEIESGCLMVSVADIARHSARLRWWNRSLVLRSRARMDFNGSRIRWHEDSWAAHCVDLDAGRVVASFDGFQVLPYSVEMDSGREAWLLNERGMPYRFDPELLDLQDPTSSLKPILGPPWGSEP
ncbi:MAG: hypothetical protein MPN21_19655 [Thermoanaerobaculia bacterium]|nr:hypothetical protein [Thermoanaerobaculia bacterium]